MTPRRIPATILLVLVTGWSATRADQPSPRDRYFDGLRQRGLFSLAEGVCFQELAQADLPPDLRLDSTRLSNSPGHSSSTPRPQAVHNNGISGTAPGPFSTNSTPSSRSTPAACG